MSIRPFRDIKRRKTKVISVGNVKVGGDNPISVQSMTNTLTTDKKSTIKQINEIQNEGADLVRVSCPDEDPQKLLKKLLKMLIYLLLLIFIFIIKEQLKLQKMGQVV